MMGVIASARGKERKKLVEAISEIVGVPAKYKGAPSFDYEVGDFIVDKKGTVSFDPATESSVVQALMAQLAERGFEIESPDRITIEVPLEGFTTQALENLEKLIASKADLIKKAIGTDSLELERTKNTVKFPWFPLGSSDEVDAFYLLVEGLCRTAKKRKRVTAKEKSLENEKFAFRVFLIQLGFVGDEYKQARKILLKNLTGNSAFRDGAPTKMEVADNE